MGTPPIQWYPGHIAKAEKALMEQLKRVDLVIEVRDARIPTASCHPQIPQWMGDKAHVLVMNRLDLITPVAHQLWQAWLTEQGTHPCFTDAQRGKGIKAVIKAAQAVGVKINERRHRRGMRPRAVRAVVVGFPNVGKSALINRLLKRKIVASARRPGVTRQLRWVRISEQLDLLDTPGVLPARLQDQAAAYRLAMCDDIGTAAYDNQLVAAALVDRIQQMQAVNQRAPGYCPTASLQNRYQWDPDPYNGADYVATLAQQQYQDDSERAACQLLTDYRKGLLGPVALEAPPTVAADAV